MTSPEYTVKKSTNILSFTVFTKSIALCLLAVSTLPSIAMAADDSDVLKFTIEKQGRMAEHQVVFVPFSGDNVISNLVLQDLSTTSLKVTSENLIQQPHSSQDLSATLPAWQQLGIPYLVVGRTSSERNNLTANFEVIETATGRIIKGSQRVTGRDAQEVAHKTAGRIYEMITGNKSDFNARIAYVEEKGTGAKKTSSLVIRDANGENPKVIAQVTDGSIFSPAVSPDGRYIAYSVQLKDHRANLFTQHLGTNHVTKLATDLKGSNLSPSFSADGTTILFSSTADGDADIYRISSTGGTAQKIIDLPYDQVQPSYAPDGSFVFVSDHTSPRRPSIYRYSSGTVRRLSRGGYAANPTYSADGSKLGYLSGGSAAVMNGSGSNIANFGNTGIDEAPRFSPSGERVVYSQGKNNSTLVIRSIGGGKTITKRVSGTARSPVWIPSND